MARANVVYPSSLNNDLKYFLSLVVSNPQLAFVSGVVENDVATPFTHVSSLETPFDTAPYDRPFFPRYILGDLLRRANLALPTLAPPLKAAATDVLNGLDKFPLFSQNEKLFEAKTILQLPEVDA